MTVGSKPPLSSSVATSVVVVVLPWVPAMATFERSRISSASISARRTTGRPRRLASSSSGLPLRMAVEITTTEASPRFSAFCPSNTRAPSCSSRAVIFERFASEPWTV